jgi:hypothetical protein
VEAVSQDAARTLHQFQNVPPDRNAPPKATTAGTVAPRWRYGERTFQLSKNQPGQTACSESGCQRQSRAEHHRRNIATDPEYRQVCWTARRNGGPVVFAG